ncbi:DUF202 domain-containing protein [Gordonia sp. X0973]|uniref:YidH family protein n=1 Tax=Gordonia sp. X0973 TaxID=2742602 RepID=UPI000F546297|nr:DUF202 domain-containing protein [Gordonia sp. X0973]QKT07184.1 DUF202 domain-containing protein [Gordonia sp. X0973]
MSDDDSDAAPIPPGAVDARFTLAAERTMLAWLRTAMGLIAAGVAVLHLFDPFGNSTARTVFGSGLVLVGAVTAVIGVLRWRKVARALSKGGPMPGPLPVMLLCLVLVVVALGFVVWS